MKPDSGTDFIRAEMHCHTAWSLDSGTRLPDLLRAARERGIHRLAITDHNTIRGALAARELDPDLVVVGEEILTTGGELLAYYVEEEVPKRLTPMETIERLKHQGAVIAIPHVFDVRRHGWREQDLQEILPHVDALEVFNARCFSNKVNRRAEQFAREVGLPGFAGSDAHSLVELGLAVTWLADFNDAEELRAALKHAHWEGELLSAGQHLRASIKIGLGRLRPNKKTP
jgi:hypothetical protein